MRPLSWRVVHLLPWAITRGPSGAGSRCAHMTIISPHQPIAGCGCDMTPTPH